MPVTLAECPSCGRTTVSAAPLLHVGFAPIRRYFTDLSQIISHPTQFFRRMPITGGLSGPLAFALVTHWLGSAVAYLWHALMSGSITERVGRLLQLAGNVTEVDHPGRGARLMALQDQITHWMWGAGSVIVDPFLTLVSIVFTTFLVWVGARILVTPGKNGAPTEITYESALRIVCFGMSPAILAVIPLVGGFVAALGAMIVTVIGAREVYRIEVGRAIVVALFPKVLLLSVVGTGMFLVVIFMIKAIATTF